MAIERCFDDKAHCFKFIGPIYTKDSSTRYGYTTIFCRKCGTTKELVAVDRGEKFEGEHPVDEDVDPDIDGDVSIM